MKKALAGEQFTPCEIPYRKNEKYWLLQPDKDEVQIIFSVNYEDKTEQALARVMMIEYTASEKKIQRSANISYKEAAPQELVAKFPSVAQEKPTNGFLVIKLNAGLHLKAGIEQPLTFATGFRQYMHFHMHAIKQQLHSKMRKRVNAFENVVKMAKRVQEKDGAKEWKENFGG